MTQLKIRAIWTFIIFSLVLIGLCVVFFSFGGPDTFLDGETRVTWSRVFITFGFIFNFIMRLSTRRKAGRKAPIKDERDEMIEKRALAAGFYVVMLLVFLFCLFLYWYHKIHLATLLMPVGWVWFLAIAGFCVGHMGQSFATLILDKRMSGDGER